MPIAEALVATIALSRSPRRPPLFSSASL